MIRKRGVCVFQQDGHPRCWIPPVVVLLFQIPSSNGWDLYSLLRRSKISPSLSASEFFFICPLHPLSRSQLVRSPLPEFSSSHRLLLGVWSCIIKDDWRTAAQHDTFRSRVYLQKCFQIIISPVYLRKLNDFNWDRNLQEGEWRWTGHVLR